MIQIYIQYKDDQYYQLDIDKAEAINLKNTLKDLNDISSIFAPFTQTFKIKATPKNIRLLGFIGNEKIQRLSDNNTFNSKIYIENSLFDTGILTFKNANYQSNILIDISLSFATNLTAIKQRLGDLTIQDMFDLTDSRYNFSWDTTRLNTYLQSEQFFVGGSFRIPFISNQRLFVYDNDLSKAFNIKFNSVRNDSLQNYIKLNEVRPSITFSTILEAIISKLNLNVICPLFERPEYKDLQVYCNAEKLLSENRTPVIYTFDEFSLIKNESGDITNLTPLTYNSPLKYKVSNSNPAAGIFKIKRQNTPPQEVWDNFFVRLEFPNLVSIDGSDTSILVNLVNGTTGQTFNSQTIEGNQAVFYLNDTIFNSNNEAFFYLEFLPLSLLTFSKPIITISQHYFRIFPGVDVYYDLEYRFSKLNFNPNNNGVGIFNLISALPKTKAIDFLVSFFKTFNISVISTGKEDNSMYWLTDSDIDSIGKVYSKEIRDYTQYVDLKTVTKEPATNFNQYIFKHFESKYFNSKYGDGSYFGTLKYPTTDPTEAKKFEVKTGFSLIRSSSDFPHPTAKQTLGFKNETPEILSNGGKIYKPVFDELTIFYTKKILFGGVGVLSTQGTPSVNFPLNGVFEVEFKASNGKSLSFSADNESNDSLYINYYKNFIELILNPNAYLTTYDINLSANELVLIERTTTATPKGFRIQNELVIKELRNKIIDSTINLTNGKGKIKVINI